VRTLPLDDENATVVLRSISDVGEWSIHVRYYDHVWRRYAWDECQAKLPDFFKALDARRGGMTQSE
jgi:hypothetical protein